MEPAPQKPPEGGGYGYNYGGNYAGYSAIGYGYGEGGGVQRNFQDYLLILRERIWYIIVVFLVVFSSALVYTLSQQKIYQAAVSVKVRRHATNVLLDRPVDQQYQEIQSAEELNTLIKEVESTTIVKRVALRLTGDDLRTFMTPYETGSTPDIGSPEQILLDNRLVS